MSVQAVNPGADVIGAKHALMANISAAKGLAEVVKSNLGPKGTMKMLVSGAGLIKITKDGNTLLGEMQIQHPTAAIIARTATAQDDITGDGTTSNVIFTGEILKQAERYINEGTHPRFIVDGLEKARDKTMQLTEEFKVPIDFKASGVDKELLEGVARTSLRTKVADEVADHLAPIVTSAVLTVYRPDKEGIDLHMVEIMHMKHKSALDTTFIDGLVLDHGARHPDMARRTENAFIFVCNVSLEYEKSMVNSGFFYKDADERAKLAAAERKFTDDKVNKIIALKRLVCDGKVDKDGKPQERGFIVINQKGIDPPSLEMLQKVGIVAIRRAKRRNMERLPRACGGYAVNSVDDLKPDCLGEAKLVYEHQLGDDVYTFVEGTKHASSCTILIRGPTDHSIAQAKDAIHDGLRAVTNVIEDKAVVPGAGAFELWAHRKLLAFRDEVEGRAKLGVQAFADALLVIPKVLAANANFDAQGTLIELLDAVGKANAKDGSSAIGLDIETGKPCVPKAKGIWDNLRVKKQFLHLGSLIAVKLLLVDEIMRAGKKMGGKE